MRLSPGSRLGPYELLSLLGSGGMGEVYRAKDERLHREVALKLIPPRSSRDDTTVDRFAREAVAASSLNHPNVVTVHDIGHAAEGRYIAMELVHGRTLRELMRNGLTFEGALPIARQIAEALAAAHAAHIIHRDVKPENVMVREDGWVKVLDFGLARLDPAEAEQDATVSAATQTGLVLGTVSYMSPEQGQARPITSATDIFSFGIVLYEMLCGRHPFHAPTPVAMLHAIVADEPMPPSRLNPDLPASLERLVLDCLEKDHRLRPDAAEIVARLRGDLERDPSAIRFARPTPRIIVGRARETEALLQAYADAQAGRGVMMAVAGEPGVGKTTLVDDVLATIASRHDARVARGRCSERLAGSEAYLPVLEAMDALLGQESHGSLARMLRALAPNWYLQIMSLPDGDSSAVRAAAEGTGSQQRMKREMAAFLQEASQSRPIVLFLDDVHWADVSTVDLLAYLADRVAAMRLLVIVSHRPSELAQRRHPFLSLKLDLQSRRVCREIVLEYLSRDAVERYIEAEYPGHAFPADFAALIHAKTEGHALFLVDVLRDLRLSGAIRIEDGRAVLRDDLSTVARDLPESVRSMIERKVTALDEAGRRLLTAAAVQGYDFDSAILAHTLDLSEADVEEQLDRLEREHAFVRFVEEAAYPDGTVTMRYRFTHALYQNALFGTLRPARRAQLASAVASALIRRWAERSPEVAPDLAVLFETARAPLMAARYYSLAAQSASRLFAHQEAGKLAARGLAQLGAAPDTPARKSIELELQMSRALAVKTTGGYAVPEVGAAYTRARELCQLVENPGQVIPVLIGLSAHYIAAGDIRSAQDIAEQLLRLAERVGDPHLRMVAEWSLGAALHHLGQLPAAHAHLTRALDLYDPAFHEARAWEVGIEPGVFCMCETSRVLWLLGSPDQSMTKSLRAEERARALGHPQTLAFVLLFRMLICHLRRDPATMRVVHAELLALCEGKGIAQEMLWARAVHGWALAESGELDRGLHEIEAGLADQDRVHAELLRPYYLMLQAEALSRAGRLDDAWGNLTRAGAISEATGQFMFEAELHRLRGELILARTPAQAGPAREAFQRALAIARQQQALSLELRAARSLAILLERSGAREEARRALAPAYERFTEGLETPDLAEARAVLDRLESPVPTRPEAS